MDRTLFSVIALLFLSVLHFRITLSTSRIYVFPYLVWSVFVMFFLFSALGVLDIGVFVPTSTVMIPPPEYPFPFYLYAGIVLLSAWIVLLTYAALFWLSNLMRAHLWYDGFDVP